MDRHESNQRTGSNVYLENLASTGSYDWSDWLYFQGRRDPEQALLEELDAIDLHHGPYSTSAPYRELVVVGAVLTPSVRSTLSKIGFEHFIERPHGFSATRSEEKARELRQSV